MSLQDSKFNGITMTKQQVIEWSKICRAIEANLRYREPIDIDVFTGPGD
jgi:hypothetical protein